MTAGERWAADALTSVRDAEFRPDAIASFLSSSFARAADTRSSRPELRHQAHTWIVTGALGALVLRQSAARRHRPVPTRRALTIWLASVSLMLDWHLGMVEGLAGERRGRLSTADALTLARAALAPFVEAAPPDQRWFTLLLVVAGASDFVDGALARATGPTRFGRDFDSLADTSFRLAALLGAARADWITPGATRALVVRQVVLGTRAMWHWFARSSRPPADQRLLARWHVPLMLTGLTLGALGEKRVAGRVLYASAVLGSITYLDANRLRGRVICVNPFHADGGSNR